ncbi:hypothetical protein Golomagni_02295 [Golovinomyces magnicellulatus]|nr:hypothetical protein Golomagni_02295 [Golovinomyces magnicellulatus]
MEYASIKQEEESYDGLGLSGLILPNSMKLRGAENYLQWKQVMIRNIIASGLLMYFQNKVTPGPSIDIENWKFISQKELDKVPVWVKGKTRASNFIMYNCNTTPQLIISSYHKAADMWEALEQAYEGSGIVVQYQELTKFISARYEDHKDLTTFITFFKNTTQRLSQVMDQGEKIPSYWPAMLFVNALQNKFPIWADRQRNRQREKNEINRPSLEDLIADIQDEARRDEEIGDKLNKSDGTKALNLSIENSRKGEKCKTCEKHLAWEQRTGKKWLSKDEFQKNKTSQNQENDSVNNIKGKTVDLYSCATELRHVLPAVPVESLNTNDSGFLPEIMTSKRCEINSGDRWLADSGADSMVTNNKLDFTAYTNHPLEIKRAGGTTISPGVGTMKLEVQLTSGTTRDIKLSSVRSMPQCPVKLVSLRKIINSGGSLHANKIVYLDQDDNKLMELCEIDESGYLVESDIGH